MGGGLFDLKWLTITANRSARPPPSGLNAWASGSRAFRIAGELVRILCQIVELPLAASVLNIDEVPGADAIENGRLIKLLRRQPAEFGLPDQLLLELAPLDQEALPPGLLGVLQQGQEGAATSSMQLASILGTAFGAGIGGAWIAALSDGDEASRSSLVTQDLLMIGVLAVAVVVVRNVPAWPSRDRQASESEPEPASVPVGEAAEAVAD